MTNTTEKNWEEINQTISGKLLELYRSRSAMTDKTIGKVLFDLAAAEPTFKRYNPWFVQGMQMFKDNSFTKINIAEAGFIELDPLQLFLSYSMSSKTKLNRTESAKALYRVLSLEIDFESIDFTGCPAPQPVQAIQFRNSLEVEMLWELFALVKNGTLIKQKEYIDRYLQIRGVKAIMFSIYCFWINPQLYIPVDRYTVEYLGRTKRISPEDALSNDRDLFISLNNNFSYRQGQSNKEIVAAAYKDFEAEISGEETVVKGLHFRILGFRVLKRNAALHKILNHKGAQETQWFILDQRLEPVMGRTIAEDEEPIVNFTASDIDIYGIEEGPVRINITAIVGKNGSGKSTLLDLFNMLVYNISVKHGLIENDSGSEPLHLDDVNFEVYFEYGGLYKWQSKGENTVLYMGTPAGFNMAEYAFEAVPADKEVRYLAIFYSIIANYSIYSLNPSQYRIKGIEWLYALSHKNDGYQTPLVISPMRENDMINVGKEKSLNKQRLLLNLLTLHDNTDSTFTSGHKSTNSNIDIESKSFRNFGNGKSFTHVKITGDSARIKAYKNSLEMPADTRKNTLSQAEIAFNTGKKSEFKILERYLEHLPTEIVDKIFEPIAAELALPAEIRVEYKLYLLIKLLKMVYYYDFHRPTKEYFEGLVSDLTGTFNFNDVLGRIKADNSHITDKFKQVVHYLTIPGLHELYNTQNTLLDLNQINELIRSLYVGSTDQEEVIRFHDKQYIIPPIFEYEFYYNDQVEATSLSSGEEQLVSVMSTLLYHIRNVESKHLTETEDASLQYRNINIILDEIELYFHPEYQRQFINRLVVGLKKMSLDEINIDSINIIFTTHSPFILSDISGDKILRLNDGAAVASESGKFNSFAANIYDLLKDDFFMSKGAIGAFSKRYINALTKELEEANNTDRLSEDQLKKKIDIIGEPLIKNALLELWRQKFTAPSYDELLKLYYNNPGKA